MVKDLTHSDLFSLVRGMSFVNSGASRPRVMHQKTTSSHPNPSVQIKELEEFSPEDLIVTAFEFGPCNTLEMDKFLILHKALKALEQKLGQKVAGLYFSHHGSESALIDTAFLSNLPLADIDITGGLVFPKTEINLLNLYGIANKFWPFVVATDNNEIITFEGLLPHSRCDEIFETCASLSKDNNIFVLGGALRVKDLVKTPADNKGLSKYMRYGGLPDLNDIIKNFDIRESFSGKVDTVKILNSEPYYEAIASLTMASGHKVKLLIKNAALYILDEQDNILASPPERIFLFKDSVFLGFTNISDIAPEQTLNVMVINPEKAWQESEAAQYLNEHKLDSLLNRGRLLLLG